MTADAASTSALAPSGATSERALKDRTDEDLIDAYKGGEVGAFRVLVERHEGAVFRFCMRSLNNREAAADATQEVFLRVVKNAPRWERKAKFTTWMYTVARNFLIDEARKARFRRTESLNQPLARDEDGGDERIDRVEAEQVPSDRIADSKRMREAIDEAVDALPDEQREVFCLRQYQGMAFKEIGLAVGVGENTVKSRMRYALQSLRKALESAGFHPPDSS
jgi:RNA polymerase sigma-70 factor (ECF subfamily)